MKGGRGGASTRKISFVSLVAYDSKVFYSGLTMGGYSFWNQAGRFPTPPPFFLHFKGIYLLIFMLNIYWGPVPATQRTYEYNYRPVISNFTYIFIFKDFIYLFLEREEERRIQGREILMWQRNVDWLPFPCAPTGDWIHNPGMWPDQQLKPFALPKTPNQLSHTGQGYIYILT